MDANPGPSSRTIFAGFAVAVFVLLPILSIDFGITTDEIFQNAYGQCVLQFYLSWSQNDSCLLYQNWYLYGGLFDGLAAAVFSAFPNLDEFEIRHVLNAVFGSLAILYTGLLARKIGGPWVGVLAMLLLIVSPRFLGHAMNNTKDIPFAASYVIGLYYMTSLLCDRDGPKPGAALGLALGIALAIGARPGGLILIAYCLGFAAVACVSDWRLERDTRRTARILGFSALAAFLGYAAGVLLWPYAMQNPIVNPWSAVQQVANFDHDTHLLFDGQLRSTLSLPWYYASKWILISTPLTIPLGLALVLFALTKGYESSRAGPGRREGRILMILGVAVLFPLVFIVIRNSTLYNGWRHLIFVYPPLVVAASVGWVWFLRRLSSMTAIVPAGLVLAATILEPIAWSVRNHPHQTVYFNTLAGGVRGAFGYYELDYWGNSLGTAAKWLAAHDKTPRQQVKVVSFGAWETEAVVHQLNSIRPGRYLAFDPAVGEWDYALLMSRQLSRQQLLEGWPPAGTIHAVEVDGVPIAVVRENRGHIGEN